MGWLDRLFGAPRASVPAPAPAPVVEASAAVAAPQAAPAYGLKRALVARDGQVGAFELQLPDASARRLAQRPDLAVSAALHATLLTAAATVARPTRPVLVRLPAAVLAREAVLAVVKPHVWLCVDSLAELPESAAQTVRQRNARLGLADGTPAVRPALDFVLLKHAAGGIDTQLLAAERWREVQPRVAVVAVDLPHLDDVERLLRAGFALAGGHLGRSAGGAPVRPLGAAAHRICELMNHVALDHGTAVVAESVRGDVALSYRLLRYANSPSIGLKTPVDTVDQAVTVLGRAELGRWLAVLLLSATDSRQASRALQETALARGRLIELVARERGDGDAKAGFTLGLLSMIELLLQVPLAAAVAPLRLNDNALRALVHREGPWAPYLALAEALEGDDETLVDTRAAALGVAWQVRMLQDEAWVWASGLVERPGA